MIRNKILSIAARVALVGPMIGVCAGLVTPPVPQAWRQLTPGTYTFSPHDVARIVVEEACGGGGGGAGGSAGSLQSGGSGGGGGGGSQSSKSHPVGNDPFVMDIQRGDQIRVVVGAHGVGGRSGTKDGVAPTSGADGAATTIELIRHGQVSLSAYYPGAPGGAVDPDRRTTNSDPRVDLGENGERGDDEYSGRGGVGGEGGKGVTGITGAGGRNGLSRNAPDATAGETKDRCAGGGGGGGGFGGMRDIGSSVIGNGGPGGNGGDGMVSLFLWRSR